MALLGCAVLAQTGFDGLQLKAEALYAQGSFAKANEVYQQAKGLKLEPSQERWVAFRLADTLWRSQAQSASADNTLLERARHELEGLVRDVARVEDHDRVWAETEESLGDYFWTRRNAQDFGQAGPHYQNALDWWAGSTDINLARQRYLNIVWKVAHPANLPPQPFYYGAYGNILPLDVLENAAKIAQSDEDKAHAHFLIAMTLRQQGGGPDFRRVPKEFEAALKAGKKTEWYDSALFYYAEWTENQGLMVPLKTGGWTREQDFPKALELFRRLVKEFKKGESQFWESAQQQIKNITDPQLNVAAGNFFLPDSEIQFGLSWRNVPRVEFALYPVDLTRDVNLAGEGDKHNDWLQSIDLSGRETVKTWSRETQDTGKYRPGNDTVRLDKKLAPGAYILEAQGKGQRSRDLILVSDASLVLRTSGKQALAFVCNALVGSPLSHAHVHLWERYWEDGHWHWKEQSKEANGDGLAVFDLVASSNNQLFISAIAKDRQTFCAGNSFYSGQGPQVPWKIYAFTDRPAYRPKETVQWKFIARQNNGSVYSTPAGQVVSYEISDPRGTKVKVDKATLNSFGSAWGSLELTESMPLGEYNVNFWDENHKNSIGSATLFRLEEYKLPEFKVSVQTPEENGHKKAFRLGEKVSVNIQADYYFGGPVANANVEVLVKQTPFYHIWSQPRPYPWYFNDFSPFGGRGRPWNGGPEQIVKRETLKTDATGKAALSFDTPEDSQQDFEYQVEARVTDSSRREIVGAGSVRVTRQRYSVHPAAEHNIYRPQDKVRINLKAIDANDQPVQVQGSVKVTRDYWYEIWLDPLGREVKGEPLNRLRQKAIFPPPPKPGERSWQLKFRGYENDEILVRTVQTDTNGAAQLTFTPEREGYYRVAWTSEDSAGDTNASPALPIEAETTVWVATGATTALGYHSGGMEIIVDKDSFRVGQKAPIMLSVPTNDRYVLFSVEGTDLYSYQLIHLSGDVKLVELPIEEKHVPNIFLNAVLVSDRQMFVDSKEVIVPPTRNFLTVDVKSDREQYQPREQGTFTITTLDHENKPVAAEVSFGLVDESVYYIQPDYAGDPRQFYFGTKRSQSVQTQSSFNQKSYAKLVEGNEKQLIDERDLDQKKDLSRLDDLWKDKFSDRGMVHGPLYASGINRSFGGRLMASDSMIMTKAKMPANAEIPLLAPMSASGSLPQGGFPVPGMSGVAGEEPAVEVRTDFRSTILWQPDVHTGPDGKATVKVQYPDSLTSWKATARAVTEGNQFGIATNTTRTKQPLIVRLQAPRFFVVGDAVTISAIVNNNTDQALEVSPKLEADGVTISGLYVGPNGVVKGERAGTIKVEANSEARADWAVSATQAGSARLKVTARGGQYADAMEKSYTVYEHGIEKFISKSGKVRGDDVTVKLELPKERKAGSTTLTVQVTPSMAVTMLDALPYLINYPYGCTEQTMSRFLPAAITAKTLHDLSLHPEDIMGRVFGGIESASAAQTHPGGKHDLKELTDMEDQGLHRLYDFQHDDGGWGWWKEDKSDHYMSAYVVWGLTLARGAGIEVKSDVLEHGVNYLDKTVVEETPNYDAQAWMLHALSAYHALSKKTRVGEFQAKAFDNLWKNREKLNAYSRALLALSAHYYGYADKAKILVDNLENGVKKDDAPDISVVMQSGQQSSPAVIGTAHWGEEGLYYRWSDGGIEGTAFALRALLAIDPQNKLVEPVANWLIKNRRGAQWSNTRDTAITVLALNDYLRASGELTPEIEYELLVNGQSIASKKISGADVFQAPSQYVIPTNIIRDVNEVRIVRRNGSGPIYFAASAKFFSLEEPITPAGNEIFVRRQYYKLVGHPTLLKGYVYERQPLNDGDSVKSGDRVETVLTIEAKNDYEYLVFEDLKPAGLEAVEVRSGESLNARELKSGAVEHRFGAATNNVIQPAQATPPQAAPKANSRIRGRIRPVIPVPQPQVEDPDHTGRSQWVYQELRDRKVALFISKLPQGVWEIKYDLRAEVPGQFHALPVVGHAMYVPEIRCNGAEIRIRVQDR